MKRLEFQAALKRNDVRVLGERTWDAFPMLEPQEEILDVDLCLHLYGNGNAGWFVKRCRDALYDREENKKCR